MAFKNNKLFSILFLVFISALAFVFRFAGIKYGLPVPGREYSVHPDEFLTVETAFEKVVRSFDPDLGFYNYPSLYMFVSGLFMTFGVTFGGVSLGDIYLYARYAAAVMGALSVPVVILAGGRLFNYKAGIIAGIVLALAPLHIMHSHFAAVDVPSTLFIAAALLLCGLILKKGSYTEVIFAGAAAGLAAGTKYNCCLVFLSVICAICLSKGALKDKAQKCFLSCLCAIAAFLISTPGAILNSHGFMSAIMYEKAHTASGHSNVFEGLGSPFVFNYIYNLFTGFGAVASFVALVGLVYGLVRKNRSVLVLCAFVLPYYVLMSVSKVNFSRYMIPLYPALSLFAGYIMDSVMSQQSVDRVKKLFVYAVVLLFGITLIFPARETLVYFRKSVPQDNCALYLQAKKGRIGILDYPWFYSPAYSARSGYGTLPLRKEEFENNPRLVMFSENDLPEIVVVSDYEFYDELRLWQPDKTGLNYKKLLSGKDLNYKGTDPVLAKLELISCGYTLEKTFSGGSGICLLNSPHDMCYINPQIYVFRKK